MLQRGRETWRKERREIVRESSVGKSSEDVRREKAKGREKK